MVGILAAELEKVAGALSPLVLCYADPVANLTLVISDEVLKEARVLALRQDTSVNQLVRAYLEGLVAKGGGVRRRGSVWRAPDRIMWRRGFKNALRLRGIAHKKQLDTFLHGLGVRG